MGTVNIGALTSGLLKIGVSGGVATPATAVAGSDYATPALKYVSYTATCTALDVVYMAAAGTVARAKGDAVGTVYAIGFALETKTGAACKIQTGGIITVIGKTFTPGLPVFISDTTAGDCTQTAPTANGHYAQMVGVALTATDVEINIGPVVQVSTGTVAVAAGKTVTINNTMTIAADDDTSAPTLPAGAFRVAGQAAIQNGSYIYAATAGGTTAYTLTPAPAIAALAAGQKFRVLVNATNTGASTLAVSGKTATAINKQSATGAMVAIVAGDLVINTIAELVYDGSVFELLNPGLPFAASATKWGAYASIAGPAQARTITFADADQTVASIAGTQTLTNKRITPRVVELPHNDGTLTTGNTEYNVDNADQFVILTGLGQDTNFGVPNGTPVDGQKLTIRILCDGTLRNLTWTGTAGGWVSRGVTLPATAAASKYLYIGFIYNGVAGVWDCVATAQEA
jgi:hypothetical protein